MGNHYEFEVRKLSAAECRERLASADHGQLATSQRSLPAIVPVWVRQDGDAISVTSILGHSVELETGTVVALEVGPLEARDESTWAVEVCGVLETGVDPTIAPPRHSSSDDAIHFRLRDNNLRGWIATATPRHELSLASQSGISRH
jgi:hypothetical protein